MLLDVPLVGLEELAALSEGPIAVPSQGREPLHDPNWHAGGAESSQELDPHLILSQVAAVTAGSPPDRIEQAYPLVVAERMRAQPRADRELANGDACVHLEDNLRTSSTL